jgi:hypothetical protein
MKILGAGRRVPKSVCPICFTALDAASGVGGDLVPSEGDVTVCLECGNIAVFTVDLRLRVPTEEEFSQLKHDRRILAMQIAVRRLHGKMTE